MFITLAWYNAEARLNPYEERQEFRVWPWKTSGRNTKLPFREEHGDRVLFYNPAVNPNPHTGYEDGDNVRRLYQAPPGFFQDPKYKGTPDTTSLEANIFSKTFLSVTKCRNFTVFYRARMARGTRNLG